MHKFFMFKSERFIDKKTMMNLIGSFYIDDFSIEYVDHQFGYVVADQHFSLLIGEVLPTINNDLGTKIVFLATHAINPVSILALEYAYQNLQGFNHLSDVVLDLLLSRFDDIKRLVVNEFSLVSHDLILTAQAYLKAGLNASSASEMLYIHRNTFNYRLAKFIELTSLDIRDYWHAFYFNLYLKLLNK